MRIAAILPVFFILLFSGAALAGSADAGSLAGVWRPDMEATMAEFAIPGDLKNDLQDITISISAPASGKDGSMLLEWKDGANQRCALKVVSQKGDILTVKIDGKHDLEADVSQKDILVLHEEPNRLILKRAAAGR